MSAFILVAILTVAVAGGRPDSAQEKPLPQASAIVFLKDIKQTTAKVAIDTSETRPELVACEIGVSNELNEADSCQAPAIQVFVDGQMRRPRAPQKWTIVADDMRSGEPTIQVLFPANIRDVDVGFVASLGRGRLKSRKELSLEIQPRVKLPSGDEYPFTELGCRAAMSCQCERAQQVKNKEESMFKLRNFGHSSGRFAQHQACQQLEDECRCLQTNIREDAAALQEIYKYWSSKASHASVYVRLVAMGNTLPAEVNFTNARCLCSKTDGKKCTRTPRYNEIGWSR